MVQARISPRSSHGTEILGICLENRRWFVVDLYFAVPLLTLLFTKPLLSFHFFCSCSVAVHGVVSVQRHSCHSWLEHSVGSGAIQPLNTNCGLQRRKRQPGLWAVVENWSTNTTCHAEGRMEVCATSTRPGASATARQTHKLIANTRHYSIPFLYFKCEVLHIFCSEIVCTCQTMTARILISPSAPADEF